VRGLSRIALLHSFVALLTMADVDIEASPDGLAHDFLLILRLGPIEDHAPPAATPPSLSVKNRLDEVKFRCFPVKRTLRRQECSPRRSGGERTVYLSCSTKRFPPSCCFASRRQRSNETDAGRPVQRKLLAAGPANHTGGSRNRHGGDWLPGRPQGEGFRNPESGFCDRCGDVLRV